MAKDLLARVSKTTLASLLRVEPKTFEVSRVLAADLDVDSVDSLYITHRSVWAPLEGKSTAERMDMVVRAMAGEILQAVAEGEMTRVFLVDALVCEIGERDQGFIAFSWKQKYAIA